MRYIKKLWASCLCIILSVLMYGYFETTSFGYYNSPELIESTKDNYIVEELGKHSKVGNLEIHFLDVGQADSTLIVCDGQTMLIDTGLDEQGTKIQNYLQKQGIDRIDYLILTHPDADHIGSADVIMTKFDIGTIFMSEYEKETKTYKSLFKLIEKEDIHYLSPAVGNVYAFGSASFQILAPNTKYDEPNNASIAIRITHGENTFLFTGDAEKEAEADILENGLSLDADLYHVGHHGSKTSSSEELLDAALPKYAVISCGEDNVYGLPDAEVLNNFRERNIQVFRTDEQGTVVAYSDGEKITFNCAPSDTWQAGEIKK